MENNRRNRVYGRPDPDEKVNISELADNVRNQRYSIYEHLRLIYTNHF